MKEAVTRQMRQQQDKHDQKCKTWVRNVEETDTAKEKDGGQ